MSSASPAAAQAALHAIRTLALVGPGASGKTSLAEALLVAAGQIGAPGSLERGSTVSDHDPIERRLQHSLASSVMHLTHADTRIHFIDTPGGPDFLGQSLPALEAVETAAIVINAAVGIEPVGQYAIKPVFSDGHDTGLYTWDYLYDLGRRHDELWRAYLDRLAAAGIPREESA